MRKTLPLKSILLLFILSSVSFSLIFLAVIYRHRSTIFGVKPIEKARAAALGKTYTAKVIVERDGLKAEARAAVNVTAPPSSETPLLTFAVYGDSCLFSDIHAAVVSKLLEKNPELVLHVGDMIHFYNGPDGNWKTQWEDIVAPIKQRGIPIYPTMGNHEIIDSSGVSRCTNTEAYQAYRNKFPNIQFNQYGDYFFDYKGVHFASIDGLCYMGTPEKFEIIRNDLEANKDKVIVAFLHRPLYTTGAGCSSSDGLGGGADSRLLTYMRDYKVDMVFSGDDHSYQRLLPTGESTVYYVAAGGGQPFYDQTCTPSYEFVHKKIYHFIQVNIYQDRFETNAIDTNGNVFDTFSKNFAGSGVLAAADDDIPQASQGYPKIAMPSGGMSKPSRNFLSSSAGYDMIVLSADTLADPALYGLLKEAEAKNNDLIVTLYIAAQEAPAWAEDSSPFYGKVYADAKSRGWLKASCGGKTCWGGNECIDISTEWKTYIPNKLKSWVDEKDANGLVNGVFYDNIMAAPFACPADTTLWVNSTKEILINTKAKFSIVGGNSMIYPNSPYIGSMDVANHESWPGISTPCGWRSNWNNGMRAFYGWVRSGGSYVLSYNPLGKTATDYATMRLGLTGSLLADRGYYNYWPGAVGNTVVYDEYSVNITTGVADNSVLYRGYLGNPTAPAKDPLTGVTLDMVYNSQAEALCTDDTNADLSKHPWIREFQNGVVVSNPTALAVTIPIDKLITSGRLKRIKGTQDPATNTGDYVTTGVTVRPGDGIILLKTEGSVDKTLGVTLSSNPTSGVSPLRGVDLTAVVSGSATGPIKYVFYCDRGDIGTNITTPYSAIFENITEISKTAADLCNYEYSEPGTGTFSLKKGWNRIPWTSSLGYFRPSTVPSGCVFSGKYQNLFGNFLKDWGLNLTWPAQEGKLFVRCKNDAAWEL